MKNLSCNRPCMQKGEWKTICAVACTMSKQLHSKQIKYFQNSYCKLSLLPYNPTAMSTTHETTPTLEKQSKQNKIHPPHLWLEVIAIFAVGVILIFVSDCFLKEYEKIHAVVLELGIGFVVGAIVAITIESYMRGKQKIEDTKREREMEQNIFLALFRTALPDDLVHEMYQMLFSRKFIRQNLEIAIKLRHLKPVEKSNCDVPDALVLTQTVKYDAKNISDDRATHHVSPREYVLIPHPILKHPFTCFSVTSGSETQKLVSEADLAKHIQHPDGIWYYFDPPPINAPKDGIVNVTSTIELICRETDIKTWLTYFPAEHLTLTAQVEPALQDMLEFAVDQSHRLSLTYSLEKTPDGLPLHVWKLRKPVLPHQGVILYWRPKIAKTAPQTIDKPA